MSDSRQPETGRAPDRRTAIDGLVRRSLRRAGAAIAFERVWPCLVPPLLVVALFLTASWLGLWLVLPAAARFVIVALFAAALLAALWPLLRLTLPDHAAARQRVETRSALDHRPLTALEDRLAAGGGDAETERLWRAHQSRAAAGIGRLSAGLPQPRTAERDPLALRAAVLLVLIVAFTWAGPNRVERILAAFASPQASEAEIARIDAWVSPPGYTGRPPILLTGDDRPAAGADAEAAGRAHAVPEGSALVVRAPRATPVDVIATVGETPVSIEPDQADAPDAAPAEYRYTLSESGTVAVSIDGREAFEWAFDVRPDMPPSIGFAAPPDLTASRALRLAYHLEDDYGVVAAAARFTPEDGAFDPANMLVGPPDFELTLPQSRARSGTARTIRDLTRHPWAGMDVDIRLVARDDAGQEGWSARQTMALPQRAFTEPLAAALVEQRRELALDRTARQRVAMALHALAQAPERYIEDTGVYLGLRSTYWRLRYSQDDETLHSVLDQLWEIALSIEDGDLSLAAEDLRAAQERLMEALRDDASDEEIERLMAELRQALNEFMRELARQGTNREDMARMPVDPNAQTMTPQDFDRMLDAIEQMARSGARDQAQQMLSELQNMLENLQNGQMMQGQMPQDGPMGEMMNELADMIRRQQELMDRTFDLDRQAQQGDGGQGQSGEQDGESSDGLGQDQGALREALRQLLERLEEMGVDADTELGQAGESMGEAEQSLGMGDTGEALGQQGRALESLRRGSQSMAEQMMPQPGQGEGYATGDPGPGRQRTDPFGRPLRNDGPDYGQTVQVPDEIDTQRARRILEELRRRLSDPLRPRIELDYLERLLDRF